MTPFLPPEAPTAYGTEVPCVLRRNLYFVSGRKLAILERNSQNSVRTHLSFWERNVKRTVALLGIASLLACSGVILGQSSQSKPPSGKKAATGGAAKDAAAVARGKEVFQQKCSVCHFDTSEAKKIGPGLKGLN